MPVTITKRVLSGATTQGAMAINVSQTQSSGTEVHTFQTATNTLEELYLYAANSSTNVVTVNFEMGGLVGASASNSLQVQIPAKGEGLYTIFEGLPLGSSLSYAIRCGASTSFAVNLYGYVNRVVQT